ncbi:hypothetical protein EIP86_006909 [Pleurotus ostreatoroseus]|nr:hypothetical protein EIP86_006909 [Pleurotus ostreatoroseus]
MKSESVVDSVTVKKFAPTPFDEGDIILVSSNHVGFKIHKIILSVASTCFGDLLSPPQPAEQTQELDVPHVAMEEDGETLDHLLRFCYPIVPKPGIATLTEVNNVLAAATKYDLKIVIEQILKRLEDFAFTQPLRVFAIACRMGFEDQARAAAKIWKDRRPISREEKTAWMKTVAAQIYQETEMRLVSAGAFFRLMEYARTSKLEGFCRPPQSIKVNKNLDEVYSRGDGNVVLRSTDNVTFSAHRAILEMAAPSILQQPSSSMGIETGETSEVLAMFLALSLPFAERDLGSFDMAAAIWRMGVRLKIPSLCAIAKTYIAGRINEDPLSSFLVAYRYEWKDEAQIALRLCVTLDLNGTYSPQMEESPAEAYYSLLQCAHAYQESVRAACINAQSYSGETGVTHLWTVGGHKSSSTNPLPVTLYAPIVERSLRYAAKTKYLFNVRDVIDWSGELGEKLEQSLQRVTVDPSCIPLFASSDGDDSAANGTAPAMSPNHQ